MKIQVGFGGSAGGQKGRAVAPNQQENVQFSMERGIRIMN
jgi:hypothetical protein